MKIKIYKKIFKIDSTGKTRVWWIEQSGNKYWMQAGAIGGAIVKSTPTVAKGKNIGRANETTPEDQATFEIEARYTKKLSGEYHEKVGNIKKVRFVHPMLAKNFTKRIKKVRWPGYVQRKLNGARCVAQASGLFTRKGKSWVSTPHISAALKKFFIAFPNAILDGELFVDEFANDLGSTISLIRQQKPTAEDFAASEKVVKYNIFDLITDGKSVTDQSLFTVRRKRLEEIFSKFFRKERSLKLVETFKVKTEAEVEKLMGQFLEEGNEGVIFRNDAKYDFDRSDDLLKYKKFQDAEFKIVDILEGTGNRSNMAGKIELVDKKGRTFKATPKGNYNYFKEIFFNKKKYIGKMATVKFMDYSVVTAKGGGVPFFANVVAIRNYE